MFPAENYAAQLCLSCVLRSGFLAEPRNPPPPHCKQRWQCPQKRRNQIRSPRLASNKSPEFYVLEFLCKSAKTSEVNPACAERPSQATPILHATPDD